MIWHFLEVWVLLLGAFLVGCTMGAVLHELLAQSSYAAAQGAVADSVGDVVDRLKDRLGVGAVWRPERGRLIDRAEGEGPYDEAGRDQPDAGRRDGDGEAEWPDQAEPAPERDPLAEPARELPEPALEPSRAAGGVAAPADEPVAALVPDDGIVPKRPASLAEPRNGVPDNLQRIRGVGERNEARLNRLGVFHFGQIAAWTPAEMRWVGQHLAFPERIERDDWIGQAIILASGGETGFTKSAERRRVRRQKEPPSADAADAESADS